LHHEPSLAANAKLDKLPNDLGVTPCIVRADLKSPLPPRRSPPRSPPDLGRVSSKAQPHSEDGPRSREDINRTRFNG